jgi:hypothetical protein
MSRKLHAISHSGAVMAYPPPYAQVRYESWMGGSSKITSFVL